MFTTLIVQPIFNLLVVIYALLPGHDFGLAIIFFTILVRLLMWPLIKKQLRHTKAMQKLQPELRRIKAATKGDRQKEQQLMMELYKERQVNPFATLGLTLLQFPILIGLYLGLKRIIENPQQIIDFSYPFVRNLDWLKDHAAHISQLDLKFLGVVDLKRPALDHSNHWYVPALLLVAGSAATQYFQSKQLMPNANDGRSIRQILRDASSGKKADQAEMQAATSKFTTLMIPALIFFITLSIASALSLYWFTSGIVALLQQKRVLGQDEDDMEVIANKPAKASAKKQIIEGEVIEQPEPAPPKPKTTTKKKKVTPKAKKKRR